LCNNFLFEFFKYNIVNAKSISCHDILGGVVVFFFPFLVGIGPIKEVHTPPRLISQNQGSSIFFKPSDEGTLVSSTHLLHKVRTQWDHPYVTTHVF
jgi:hypothetical protein